MSGKRGRKPSKDLVKSGERILAWAQVTTIEEAEIFVVASAQALYIPSLNQWGGTDQMRRLPWRVIDRAHWESPMLTVVAGEDGADRTWRIDLLNPGNLPEFVRERVMAMIVVSEHVLLAGDQGVRLVARRPEFDVDADVGYDWSMTFDPGLDSSDPDIGAAAQRALTHFRNTFGV